MSKYKYTYITKRNKLTYIGLDDLLDPSCNDIGESYLDFLAGKWVLLSEEQVLFKEEHPNATIREVLDMKIAEREPEPSQAEVIEAEVFNRTKDRKLDEIRAQDANSNKFFISVISEGKEVANDEFWMDKDLRNSLLNVTLPALQKNGDTTTKLWSNTIPPTSIEVPIDWALNCIPVVEIYAKQTYDMMQGNIAKVYAAKTVDEINSIDVESGYPPYITFELNLTPDYDG